MVPWAPWFPAQTAPQSVLSFLQASWFCPTDMHTDKQITVCSNRSHHMLILYNVQWCCLIILKFWTRYISRVSDRLTLLEILEIRWNYFFLLVILEIYKVSWKLSGLVREFSHLSLILVTNLVFQSVSVLLTKIQYTLQFTASYFVCELFCTIASYFVQQNNSR